MTTPLVVSHCIYSQGSLGQSFIAQWNLGAYWMTYKVGVAYRFHSIFATGPENIPSLVSPAYRKHRYCLCSAQKGDAPCYFITQNYVYLDKLVKVYR